MLILLFSMNRYHAVHFLCHLVGHHLWHIVADVYHDLAHSLNHEWLTRVVGYVPADLINISPFDIASRNPWPSGSYSHRVLVLVAMSVIILLIRSNICRACFSSLTPLIESDFDSILTKTPSAWNTSSPFSSSYRYFGTTSARSGIRHPISTGRLTSATPKSFAPHQSITGRIVSLQSSRCTTSASSLLNEQKSSAWL